jgi:hypothetical protein
MNDKKTTRMASTSLHASSENFYDTARQKKKGVFMAVKNNNIIAMCFLEIPLISAFLILKYLSVA